MTGVPRTACATCAPGVCVAYSVRYILPLLPASLSFHSVAPQCRSLLSLRTWGRRAPTGAWSLILLATRVVPPVSVLAAGVPISRTNGSGGVAPPFYNGHGRIPGPIVGCLGSAAVPAHPSADQRRRTAAAHHRAFGPATGASMPQGPHRPFSTSRLSSAAIKPPRQLSFAIWPFPMLNPQHADTEHYELYPTDPRLVGSESAILLTVFEKYQLLFDFTLPSKPDGGEDKDLTFYAQLHERLTQHMADHHLHFSGSGVSPSMAALPPAGAPTAQLNRWHASRFESLPWIILAPGIKPKPGFHRKISATPHLLLFACHSRTPGPKHGPLKGPLQGQTVPHMCFPLRIQHELEDMFMQGMTQIADECLDSCPSDSGSPLPSPRIGAQAASGVGLPVFCTAATDSDEERDQLRHAIELSLAAASSSALAEAGPSRRPLPAPPVNRRPRSPGHHSLSPPYTRRRLDPVIDLRSVSPPEVTRRSFRNLTSWVLAMQLLLSRTASSVTAPSVEAAVHALLIHFESFFGGDPYTPCYESDAVVIEPSSQLGLFARRSSWKSGDALGPGVRRGILNGLMDTVFANSEVWKKIGDTHVVNVSPAGIMPDEQRLRLLTTYGFACRLYVAIESVLPPPLSLLLAFAVLSPGLEQDVIHNPAVIRMFAPHQVEMLEQWPAKRADFLAKANEDSFMDLVNSHFGLLVMRPVHYNYARQILFGCQVAFANSPEIGAFANGFNGPSFGASLKSLLIKMAAGRIQSPQDVLEHLDWQSTGDPELQAIEALYRTAFHRYLSGHGIVRHPLLPRESLTEAEREIPDDYPLARALMFLMYTTGSQLLPLSSQTIDVSSVAHLFHSSYKNAPTALGPRTPLFHRFFPFSISSCQDTARRTYRRGPTHLTAAATSALEESARGDSLMRYAHARLRSVHHNVVVDVWARRRGGCGRETKMWRWCSHVRGTRGVAQSKTCGQTAKPRVRG
ncbi:hypothetical protein B0H14DRAFT_2635380 [Mycena olivaceomarginata]|nr:hypothetical protein B0H14DRAFT_2635380 [Mycena olivaceomarginata]